MKTKFKVLLKILVLVHIFSERLCNEDEEEIEQDNFFEDRKYKVEFIENINQQSYLSQLTFEDRFVLDLYLFDQNMKNINFKIEKQYPRRCPKAILHSLGLAGFNNPVLRTSNIAICPNMKSNCCSNNDFTLLEHIWKDYYTYSELNYNYLTYYAKITLRNMDYFKEMAGHLRKETNYLICKKIGKAFQEFDFKKFSSTKFLELLSHVKNYDRSLKKGFKCFLCDYENNKHIEHNQGFVVFETDFCIDIVKNTIVYYFYLKEFFMKYFNSVSMLAKCFENNGEHIETIFPFTEKEVLAFLTPAASFYDEQCMQAYNSKNNTEIGIYCKNYCHKYKIWEFEGIQPNVITMGKMFKLIEENLLEKQEIEVIPPHDESGTFEFPFTEKKTNVFHDFDVLFNEIGISPNNIKENN